ncbi:E3 ubiquitin-protein ligase TRIM9-like isoform X1 [Macrosteles quadrilineatus]|uniref:E3 ubiquitin-protein ligase TRIM9-like isoform X1 n=1 Tax=Macrosteles quadrilineatus TaxID=74068 RepID=UPI0023E18B3D|nr:E3 ubiquitin-protein ligase TRIM9-like isoform X1 [Macrosteles quadrilineatus]
MEEELRCPACKQLYNNPVLLPCYHTLCLNCALHLQQSVSTSSSSQPPSEVSSDSQTAQSTEEVDKLSILSETDSGVVCSSRPNSYVGTPNMQGVLFPPLAASALSLACPVCRKLVYFDENGANNLPKYRTMQNIVDKYVESKKLSLKCQLCAEQPGRDATVLCDQCEVLYCDTCRDNCHPPRGPLAKHTLLEPPVTRAKSKDLHCVEVGHGDETLSMYCMVCKVPVCILCLQDAANRHASHDVQPILNMCKAQKTELSQNLQQLSERARSTTEFIQRLKCMTDKLNENCAEFEEVVVAQCDALIEAIEARKQQLLEYIRQDKELKVRVLKEQVMTCTCKLQHTTGLLQFCIEALKETDSAAFLQVGSMLINRVANVDITWHKDLTASPRVSAQCDLTLDDKSVARAIDQLNFIQMKPAKDGEERQPAAPSAPCIIPEECSAENNSVTVAWQPPPTSYVEGYVLELDDGNGGEFREVYCGKETICTVDGLHFNSMYNARVKAFNSTGEGEYSELIGLQTAEVAWFTFDPCLGGPDLSFSEDNCSVSCEGYEHRVALGSVGFSRGVHYWEFSVDRYDADTDPSFGVARIDCVKDQMLGKDDKGWSMYIDKQRSWFMHANVHDQRCEGGIQSGSTVGVLLDLDRHQLSFYVNEEPQGPIAFQDLYGVFYPAVSLNRGMSVTLHTALDPPSESDDT